jgi:hypothetical protein
LRGLRRYARERHREPSPASAVVSVGQTQGGSAHSPASAGWAGGTWPVPGREDRVSRHECRTAVVLKKKTRQRGGPSSGRKRSHKERSGNLSDSRDNAKVVKLPGRAFRMFSGPRERDHASATWLQMAVGGLAGGRFTEGRTSERVGDVNKRTWLRGTVCRCLALIAAFGSLAGSKRIRQVGQGVRRGFRISGSFAVLKILSIAAGGYPKAARIDICAALERGISNGRIDSVCTFRNL